MQANYTGYYIRNDRLYGPKHAGEFYIKDHTIYGPFNSGR